ncbi:hypothetical protein BT96DRAFT_1010766 [Gymnopus androsaceus JB14]|uniref:Uncharacterized protein n=1 Tax=Gymnopus androsaceus JB14 TaxID=1447944 RepID=A0A6A4GA73_9AGAR|nr:hypothetical protein BT96DRAFT_1010766 [Gymnopus androsaceus JB14]
MSSSTVSAKQRVRKLADNIMALVKCMPKSIPLGTEDGKIYRLFFSGSKEHYSWEIKDGRLLHIHCRGPQGMQLVADYMSKSATQSWLEWEAALPKYERIHNELQALVDRQTTARLKNNAIIEDDSSDE